MAKRSALAAHLAVGWLVVACGGRSSDELSALPGGAGGGFGGSSSTGNVATGTGGSVATGGSSTSGVGGSGGSGMPPPTCQCSPDTFPPCDKWCPPGCNTSETALASARIWQITDPQYVNIVRDVLGVTLGGSDAEISGIDHSSGEFTNFSDLGPTFTDMLAQRYQSAAQKVAVLAATPTSMTRLLGSATPTMDQLTTFVTTKVARLLRRPVSAAETSALTKIYADASANPQDGGPSYAFALVIEAVLQWPSFLFRTELGSSTTPATSPFRLTPYELATAVSLALTDSGPDDSLWNKGANGTLSSPDVLAAEVDRLMTLPGAQTTMARYLSYWLWIEKLPGRAKDPVLYPEYTKTLADSLYESGFAFLKDVLLNGKLTDLFTSNKIYVNKEISTVYGIPGGMGMLPTPLQPVTSTLQERSGGILTQPALLAATNKRAAMLDPIHHGLFVLEDLLGGGDVGMIPGPPANALSVAATMHGTERELAAQRAQTSPCVGCHPTFDGFGLMRSRYDAIGRYSETRYVSGDTTVTPAKYEWATSATPIDASGTVADIVGPDLKGTLADTLALATLLASDRARRRVAYSGGHQLSTYVMGYDASTLNSCDLQQIKEHLYQSGSFTSFFRNLVTSPAFQIRDPGK